MSKYDKHIFICTNTRPPENPKGCCAAKGAEAIRDALAGALAKRGLLRRMRPNKAGCLDACAHGPALVVYPEQVWYGGVTPQDVEEIVEKHLVGGEIVSRLVIRFDA